MSAAAACCQTLLSQGPCSQLSRCSCGHLHLALGPVTVRLEEPVLLELWEVLREGLGALGYAAAKPLPKGDEGAGPPRGGWRQ